MKLQSHLFALLITLISLCGTRDAHASFAGVFFHTNAPLEEYENSNPAGVAWLVQNGFPPNLGTIHNNQELLQRLGRAKTRALTVFAVALTNEARKWRREHPVAAKNIHSEPVVKTAPKHPNTVSKAVFVLPAVDWITGEKPHKQ